MALLSVKTRIRVNLVAFLVLALGLSYLMATQVLSVLQDRYSVYAIFPDAGGVFTNQEVTYRGITVGQVGDMEVVEDGVRIELLIESGVDIPAEDIEARVMFKSAVGEQFVDLLPESDDPPYLHDGSEIPLEQTSIPVSTQELLSTLEAVLRGVPPQALEGAVEALGLGLTGRGPDIATILESTADLAELFARRAPEVEGILKKGTRVGAAFLRSSKDFERAIADLIDVSESLAFSTTDLERLMRAGNLTSEEVLALIRERRGELHQFLREFGKVNALQAEHRDDLGRILSFLPLGLEGVNNTFEPSTGLVRFSLVTDDNNPACDYGTERRSPENRGTRFPNKNLDCRAEGAGSRQSTGSVFDSLTTSPEPGDLPLSLFGVEPGLSIDATGGKLPARMSDWSWTLLYLNGL